MGDLSNPKFVRRMDVVESLLDWAASRGTPLAELAVAWTLQNPAVTSAIIGPRTMEQMQSCVRSLDTKLSVDEMARIDAFVPPGTTVL